MGRCEENRPAVQVCIFFLTPHSAQHHASPSRQRPPPSDRTEAFLWRLPLLDEAPAPVKLPGKNSVEVEVPQFPVHATHYNSTNGEGGRRERYQYLGSMPDFHSSEVTAISVKLPLLTTGLANGRIFLWRYCCG